MSARVSVQTLTEQDLNRRGRASAGLGGVPGLSEEETAAEARGQALRLPSIQLGVQSAEPVKV
jgi:hypothetical protein